MIFFREGVRVKSEQLEESELESESELPEPELSSCLPAFVGGEESDLELEAEDVSSSELEELLELEDDEELDVSSFRFFLGWLSVWPSRGASTRPFSHKNDNEQSSSLTILPFTLHSGPDMGVQFDSARA